MFGLENNRKKEIIKIIHLCPYLIIVLHNWLWWRNVIKVLYKGWNEQWVYLVFWLESCCTLTRCLCLSFLGCGPAQSWGTCSGSCGCSSGWTWGWLIINKKTHQKTSSEDKNLNLTCVCVYPKQLYSAPTSDACTHILFDDVRDDFPQGRVGINNNDADKLSAAAKNVQNSLPYIKK